MVPSESPISFWRDLHAGMCLIIAADIRLIAKRFS